jgi:hypothetical protein
MEDLKKKNRILLVIEIVIYFVIAVSIALLIIK